MNRSVFRPSPLSVFLASGTEASAPRRAVASRISLASVFGSGRQPAPLALRDGTRACGRIAKSPQNEMSQGSSTLGWRHGAYRKRRRRRAFDIAYAGERRFSAGFGKDARSYEHVEGIDRSVSNNFRTAARPGGGGRLPYIVTERLDDEGLLSLGMKFSARRQPDRYVEAGRMFGIDRPANPKRDAVFYFCHGAD